jgi:hypothetical protein
MIIRRVSTTAVIAALALTACSSAPATIRIKGAFDVDPLSGSGSCFQPGDQVKITDSSGKVLGTATLPVKPGTQTLAGVSMDSYAWTAQVPAETRYGITVGSMAPYYASQAQAVKGADLSC